MELFDGNRGEVTSLFGDDASAAPAGTERRTERGIGPHRLPRRRLAILYADVAGYSRLMCENEEATQILLGRHLDILSAHVLANGGTVCHYAGDAVLASFATARQAATCAIEAQQDLARRNRRLPSARRVQFRVGLNIAEVILARGEVFGIGVNVAARLQALAPVGGVCFSEAVRREMGGGFGWELIDLGACWLKNIDAPVHAWRFGAGPSSAPRGTPRPATAALAAALSGWVSNQPVSPARERRADGPGSGANALHNMTLVPDGAGGGAITAELGRRALGPAVCAAAERPLLCIPVDPHPDAAPTV